MGLTSWAAFKPDGKDDTAMSNMVMTEDQVSLVMSAALDNGLRVTAVHNHFIDYCSACKSAKSTGFSGERENSTKSPTSAGGCPFSGALRQLAKLVYALA